MEYEQKSKIKLKTIPIGNKDYVEVQERIRAFHEHYNGNIVCEVIDKGSMCIDRLTGKETERYEVIAKVYPYSCEPEADEYMREIYFTGHAIELATQGFINKTSALENCETSAVGRAMGFLGIGIEYGVASYQEVKQAKEVQAKSKPRSTDFKRLNFKMQTIKMLNIFPDIDNAMKKYNKDKASDDFFKSDFELYEKRADGILTDNNVDLDKAGKGLIKRDK